MDAPAFNPHSHVTLFKARIALMDYKGKFMSCFAQAEAALWTYSTDLTQRIILSEFCESMMHLLADLNDQFLLEKNELTKLEVKRCEINEKLQSLSP